MISRFTASQRSLLLTELSAGGKKKNARLSNRNKSLRGFCQAIQAFIHLLLHAEYWGGKEEEGGEMNKGSAKGGLNSLPPYPASPFLSEGPA